MSETPSESAHVRTVCPYCGVGCGMVLEVKQGKIVKVTGDKLHPANFGRLCTKGITVAQTLSGGGRLDRAWMRARREEAVLPVGIDEAITETARRLQAIIAVHGPDAVALYVSGQLSTEAQYLANKLCKGFLGTNNIESNSRLCMASAASGYKLSLGADGPPGAYTDIDKTDLMIVIGGNVSDCHPILYTRMLDRQKQGAKLVVIDPRRIPAAEKADLYLPIAPGTDLALLNGLLHLLVKAGKVDRAFIASHTEDWETTEAMLAEYPPEKVATLTGLDEAAIRTLAQWLGDAPEAMTFWTMGLNQSTHGTWHTNAICNLHLATGKIGRPGSGPFSLTGQPNAMGGREVGYMGHALPGQRAVVSADDRVFIERLWGLPSGAIRPEPGDDAVALFKKMQAGHVKALWVIGSNPAVTMPARNGVLAALEKAELVIVQDAYHPTETTRYADILLPGAVWAEAEGTMVNSERNVTLMQKAVEPPGDTLPDWEIITRVARAMGFGEAFPYRSASDVFEEIKLTANPVSGYDLRGMSYERLREGSLQWPCGPGETQGHPLRYLPSGGTTPEGVRMVFPTSTGKARFFARPALPPAEMPDGEFPFVLTTGRCAHQWHTMTKTGKVPQLNKLNPRPFLELNPEDAGMLGVATGDAVEVKSRRGRAVLPARVTDAIRAGCCFSPFHWNDEAGPDLAINATTSEEVDPVSKQPEFKFCAVKLTRVQADPQPFSLEQKEFLQALFAGVMR
ncbi:MAG TPA: nitrate reductase [Rariglobus sp.]|nr:nitrate reductase [Rariglobus sp.]